MSNRAIRLDRLRSRMLSKTDLRREFLIAAIPAGYVLAAGVFAWLAAGVTPFGVGGFAVSSAFSAGLMLFIGIVGHLVLGMRRREPVLAPVVRCGIRTPVVVCFAVFPPTFTAAKISIPSIAPFTMDRALAQLDRWLHNGVDPWRIVHASGIFRDAAVFDFVYLDLWTLVTLFVVVTLVYFDGDHARRRRYVSLYVLTWGVLGNVVAALVPSAGPIFVERLMGDPMFRGLTDALVAAGYEGSTFYATQAYLWQQFSAGSQYFGGGISAFPSVHVGVACVAALYVAERWRRFAIAGWLFLAAILTGSVFCGYHYAVDGYAAIAVVVLMHWALRTGRRLLPAVRPFRTSASSITRSM